MKKSMKSILVGSVAALAVFASSAGAAPVYNAANDHYYEAVAFTGGQNTWTWSSAKTAAEGMSVAGGYVGHLVTITSAAEQSFIVSQGLGLGTPSEFGYLLGAFRNATGDPFSWVTGEAFVYSNFLPGEPNGDTPPQTIHFFGLGSTPGGWNDVSQSDLRFPGYIVEYEKTAGTTVPEPASLALFGLALAGLASARRRKS